MSAVVPYFYAPELVMGSVVFQTHGLALCIGAVAGILVASWQSRRLLLPTGVIADTVPFVAIAAVLGGHISFLWMTSRGNPVSVWDGQSLTGAILFGGIAAVACLYLRLRYSERLFSDIWDHLNVFALAALLGGSIAKVGCFLSHERVGSPTSAWLGVQGIGLNGRAAHDLALYDLLIMAASFAALAIWSSTRGKNDFSLLVLLALGGVLPLMHSALSKA